MDSRGFLPFPSQTALVSSGGAGSSVAFSSTATASNCTGSVAYSWTFGDGQTSTQQNPSHTYSAAGSYNWTLTTSVQGVSCAKSGTITISSLPPGKPGDCDASGTVSIGEVQKAINMFLGVQAIACGADCNGDGAVSIGEVQKVINAFLGVASTC